MAHLLLTTLAIPLVAALLNTGSAARMRWISLFATVVTLAISIYVIAGYPGGGAEYAVFDYPWLGTHGGPVDIRFSIGLDGLSLWLYGLTTLLMVVAVLVSWRAIQDRAALYYSLLLALEAGIIGVFTARDIILFYIFFEFTLLPLFFLIGVWGSEERRYAAVKFFLFTFAGSVLTFLGLVAIVVCGYYQTHVLSFSIPVLTSWLAQQPLSPTLQYWIFAALFAGFAIKVPLFPLHTWLPLAHVQAPTAGSVILAGVLLKVGSYGFVRFALPMTPDAVAGAMPFLLWLCAAGIVYGALVALAQQDIKRLIAYSSVSHLGFCMLGVFALDRLGAMGGVLQMINHGLSTGGLFALVGMLYERYHTRDMKQMQGLARRLPVLAFFMVFFTLSSIGLPGLNGFSGEFPLLLGMFQRAWADAPEAWVTQLRVISVLAVSGVVLGAWYMLSMIQRVFFGPLVEPSQGTGTQHAHHDVRDLSAREVLSLGLLGVFVVWIGLWPNFFLEPMWGTVQRLAERSWAAAEGRGNVGVRVSEGVGVLRRKRLSEDVSTDFQSRTTDH